MRLGSQMDNRVDSIVPNDLAHRLRIADVLVQEGMPMRIGEIGQVLKASCVGEGIQVE
jgi:hypothetical protein